VAGVATAVVLVGLGSWAVRGSGDGHPGAPVAAGAPSGTKSPTPTVTSTTNSPAVAAGEAAKGLHKAKPTATPTHSASANTGGKGTTGSDAKAPAQTAPAGMRNITVVNRTSQTLWAVVTNSPLYPRGAHLAPGQSASVTVGNSWGGRIWGRTGCSGDASGHCLTGDCTTTCGGPTTPTTLGEFSFNAYDGMDFYDVSMVDGSNLPMYINISHTSTTDPLSASGCYQGKCTSAVDCPAAMQAKNGSQVIGCEPPCAAFGGDTYCCRGAWAGRDNCVPSKWPVDYTQVFKKAEPYAYSYAFDDGATMPCKGSCFYRVTFGVT
jgi:hypothetical protein